MCGKVMIKGLGFLSQDEDTRRREEDSLETIKANTLNDITVSFHKVYKPV